MNSLLTVISVLAFAFAGHSTAQSPSAQNPSSSPVLLEARELTTSAVNLYKEGKYADALKQSQRALELREKNLPPNHPLIIESLTNVAGIQIALNHYGEAEGAYKRILHMHEETSADSNSVADTLSVLAWLHYALGDAGRAETEYQRVLAIREQLSGKVSNDVALLLNRLIQIYELGEEFRKAEAVYKRLIAFDENAFPEASFTVNEARGNYACLLRKQRRTKEADEMDAQTHGLLSTNADSPFFEPNLNSKALRLPKPPYPIEARQQRAEGTVTVRVTINEEGRVTHACAKSGPRVFWAGCERAAYRAQFAPMMLKGKPVKVIGVTTYNFVVG